jgi:mycothiol system anti-sigma-R factor
MGEHHDHRHQTGDGNCEEALAELYTFIDGELTEERRYLISHHLDDCTQCFEAFDFEAELRIVISHRCRDEVPDALRSRIADQLASLDQLARRPNAGGPA